MIHSNPFIPFSSNEAHPYVIDFCYSSKIHILLTNQDMDFIFSFDIMKSVGPVLWRKSAGRK